MALFRQALTRSTCLAAAVAVFGTAPAFAAEYDIGEVHASWVTQITAGIGIRTQDPSCGRTGDPKAGGSGSAGCGAGVG